MADSDFLEFADLIVGLAREDYSRLTAVSPELNQEMLSKIEQNIEKARRTVTDDVIIDRMASYSASVYEAMDAAIELFRQIRFYVSKAFRDKPTVQNEFGLNDFDKAKASQSKMITFLANLEEVCKEYETQLLAVACPKSLLENIRPTYTALLEANKKQELYKRKRITLTAERIARYNEVFDSLQPIIETAKFVFENDKIRQKLYMPYAGNSEERKKRIFKLQKDKITTITNVVKAGDLYQIENTGSTEVEIYVGASENAERTQPFVVVAPKTELEIMIGADVAYDKTAPVQMLLAKIRGEGSEGQIEVLRL